MSDKFWMVYCAGRSAPTHQHETRISAEAEARRLAGNNPGCSFFVLETVSVAQKVDVVLRRIDEPVDGPAPQDDDMPF
jgi:hypothetical protein